MANQNEWTIWRIITLSFQILTVFTSFVFSIFVLVILITVLSATQGQQDQTYISDNSILELNPSGTLTESSPPASFFDFLHSGGKTFNENQISVRDVVHLIDTAATDIRIKAILLRPDSLLGINNIFAENIGDALRRFSENGKKVIAYGYDYGQSQYLLASYADEVILHPMGGIVIVGYSRIRGYVVNMLEKLGIKIHLFRTGDFKSAAEPFIRDSMSEEDRATSRVILDTLWEAYVQRVADNRNMNVATFNSFIEKPVDYFSDVKGDTAELAIKLRWANKLMTESEVRDYVEQLAPEKEAKFVQFHEYYFALKEEGELQPFSNDAEDKIGLIIAEGEIVDQTMHQDDQGEHVIAANSMVSKIEKAKEDKDIKALVVRLSTPGGSAFASERIRIALEDFQRSGRPVVISMGSVAASGGYWIASTADEIWGSKTTLTGSIGVFALIPTFESAADKIGFSTDGVQKGTLSALELTRPLPDAYSRVIDFSVQHIYSQFLQRVAKGRNLPIERVEELAQGKIWMGEAALQKGLIDNIGDLDAAVAAAASLAKLTGTWDVQELKTDPSWWHDLTDFATQTLAEANGTNMLKSIADRWLASIPFKVLLNKSIKAYALCLDCSFNSGE